MTGTGRARASNADDLVEFLLHYIGEDERVASECAWPSETVERMLADKPHYALHPHDISPTRAAHIKRWQSGRVLREVAARRLILHEHREHPMAPEGFCATCGGTQGPCMTKRLLALPCANCPGYREEWRP